MSRLRPALPDLTDVDTARAAARRAGLRLDQRLGQHLLVDRGALMAVVGALDPGAAESVLEVGPGIGTLTVELAARAGRVVAVDLDPAAVRATRAALDAAGLRDRVELVVGDALRVEPSAHALGSGWLAVGNIPYTITGALLTHLLERPDPPARAVLCVQREVARRLAAPAGGWSLATLAVRSLAEVECLDSLPPASFEPPPAVWSAILRLHPRSAMSEVERRQALAVARRAFQMRRKTLRHGLRHACGGDEAAAERLLGAVGLNPARRPGELDLDEWRRLGAAAAARR